MDKYPSLLPSYTNYILQPLDISVFRLLKAIYQAVLIVANPLTDIGPTKKEDVLYCYFEAGQKALNT